MKIFILADGTWLSDTSNLKSNIYKLKIILEKQKDCKVLYQSGIGTQYSCKFNPINLINGGLALDIDNKIKDLYKKLISIYQPGDTLHFIGYSRGAYIVRCLLGLIYNVGLPNCNQLISNKVKSNNNKVSVDLDIFINRVYFIYRSRVAHYHPHSEVSVSFRNYWSTKLEIPVDLLFCFETVGTLGIPPIPAFNLPAHYKFFNTKVNKNIKSAIHLLAKHEDRVIFNPTLMDKSTTNNNNTVLEQYIYSGDHSTLGGIDLINTGLNKLPLNYLYKRLGLSYDEPNLFDFIKSAFNWFDLLCFFVGGYKTRDLT